MQTGIDGSRNTYANVRNLRITAVPQTWDGDAPGLRIQAYKGNGDSLFPGAEVAIPDKTAAYEFIEAITSMISELGV